MAGTRSVAVVVVAGLALGGVGCVHTQHAATAIPVTVPPAGAVPRELDKAALPEYVIEPPDVLSIGVFTRPTVKDEKTNKEVPGDELRNLPVQPIQSDTIQVRPDGTVYLGVWGSVPVAGYTLSQAADAIRQRVAQQYLPDGQAKPESVVVLLDVTQYASKFYYVFTDGAGNGEQVVKLPITGSETVLDAVSNVGGLSPVSSKRNIWIARRTPHPGQPQQILPVDWVGITQHGVAATNYQVMPGDRIYVKAQRLVTIDNTITKILNPVQQIFGFTLLGASTVNQIQGRGPGFGNNF